VTITEDDKDDNYLNVLKQRMEPSLFQEINGIWDSSGLTDDHTIDLLHFMYAKHPSFDDLFKPHGISGTLNKPAGSKLKVVDEKHYNSIQVMQSNRNVTTLNPTTFLQPTKQMAISDSSYNQLPTHGHVFPSM